MTVATIAAVLAAAPTLSPNGVHAPDRTGWPEPLAAEAFHGFAGRLVRAIEPYSEADPAALLAHALAALGCLLGPTVYAEAGNALHPPRLNVGIIGATSKGRKGSAWQPIHRLLALVDPLFAEAVAEGLSSGEGLIYEVRDARGEDPGVADKRKLLVESELAAVLRVAARDGNSLTSVVRRAWDSGSLRTLVKNSPVQATGAHIGLIGHATKEELLRYLDRTELANGFANRFLWFAAKRAHLLPDGEGATDALLAPFVRELHAIQQWAKEPRRLRRDEDAHDLWHAVYERLSEGKPGMFGAATSRSEAQVLRLSVLYAALDRAPAIGVDHLEAALAVWDYAEASARWIFGEALGDPVADTILDALRVKGELDRTGITKELGRHAPKERIDSALALLQQRGRATYRAEDTGGRPREVWRAIG